MGVDVHELLNDFSKKELMSYSVGDILKVKDGDHTASAVVVDILSANSRQAGVMGIDESLLELTDWIINSMPRPFPYSRILAVTGRADPDMTGFLLAVQSSRGQTMSKR